MSKDLSNLDHISVLWVGMNSKINDLITIARKADRENFRLLAGSIANLEAAVRKLQEVEIKGTLK